MNRVIERASSTSEHRCRNCLTAARRRIACCARRDPVEYVCLPVILSCAAILVGLCVSGPSRSKHSYLISCVLRYGTAARHGNRLAELEKIQRDLTADIAVRLALRLRWRSRYGVDRSIPGSFIKETVSISAC